MNTPQGAQPPGFLAALAPIANREHTVAVSMAGGRMSVKIQALGYEPLRATGTATGLDAKLPAAIAQYARWIEAQEFDEALDDADIVLPGAAPKPAAKKPAPKKAPARRPAKPAVPKKRPAAKKPAPKAAAPGERAGKAECIADYRKLKAKHGAKLTRNLFVREAATGRRYEKLWANCWPDFVKDAERGAAPAAGAKAPKPAAPAKEPAPKASKPSAKVKVDKTPKPWRVLTKAGKELGVTVFEKKVGDGYSCSAGAFTVEAVDAEKREIRVAPRRAEAPPSTPASAPPAPPKPARGVYAIKTVDGKHIGGTTDVLLAGDMLGVGVDEYRVRSVDDNKREYIVAPDTAPAAAATTEETPQ